ncbi:MAG: hydantoinase/oxoprolinase N-terminal domain-containing protein [Labrys sp. (in: a-proteobacteria)]
MALLLGIDTGGTFTDAVLYDEATGVRATAKALTTHHDLAIGVGGAIAEVIAVSGVDPAAIALVSLSTTLATNAMVEGQGGRVGLVLIGFDAADAERPALKTALGQDPVVLIGGGHDSFGDERAPLDADRLWAEAQRLGPSLTGFAVSGRFATLNPGHEIAARDMLRSATGLPVTCGHELSARLDGPRRALTALLNARLIHLVEALIAATQARMAALGIRAPLMVVRGDGALVAADVARTKPIETIFSGPAASAVGGAYLAGARDAIISDIGGTTTDVVVLRDGRPRIDPEGALIGGFRTMVEAIAIRTTGLGGDSEVALLRDGLETTLTLGPRRVMPLSLLARSHPDIVRPALERQLNADLPNEMDGRFVLRLARGRGDLPEMEQALWDRLGEGPRALDRFIQNRREMSALNRLAARRLVIFAGLTPTDAAHALGRHGAWDIEAAELGLKLFARKRDARGRVFVEGVEAAARAIIDRLEELSVDFILDSAFAEDGFAADRLSRHALTRAALARQQGLLRFSIDLSVPVVGLGASASTYYPAIAARMHAGGIVPEHAEVANAVGAVVGGVHAQATATILQPEPGRYRALAGDSHHDFTDLPSARAYAEEQARRQASEAAIAAGAATVELTVTIADKTATVEGREIFMEGTVTVRASGRPRIG